MLSALTTSTLWFSISHGTNNGKMGSSLQTLNVLKFGPKITILCPLKKLKIGQGTQQQPKKGYLAHSCDCAYWDIACMCGVLLWLYVNIMTCLLIVLFFFFFFFIIIIIIQMTVLLSCFVWVVCLLRQS